MAKTMRSLLRLDARREGFALAMVLLVMIVLTGGVLTAYSLTTTEQWKVGDQEEQLSAFLLAQEGLNRFISSSQGAKLSDKSCTNYGDLDHGEADVCAYLLRVAVGDEPELWVVRSNARRTTSNLAHLPDAERSVAQIVYWETADLEVKAGLESLGGVINNGNDKDGKISGIDECGEKAALPALAIPATPKYDDKHSVLETGKGQDLIRYTGSDTKDAAETVSIDWKGIRDGDAIKPDIEYKSGKWENPTKDWQIIKYNGNLNASPTGKGILIVTGDMDANGSMEWEGIIMVGGRLSANGNNTVSGAIMVGLNASLGEKVEPSELNTTMNGTKTFRYNSCKVAEALAAYSSLVPISNAWMDDWPVSN